MSDNTMERWDAAYADEDDPPPWVIQEPQPEVVSLFRRQLIIGRVLDAGCGTGEHSLLAKENGLSVTGIDISPKAVATARHKAAQRALDVDFMVASVLEPLPFEDGAFDTVLDSGVFHSFEGAEQSAYVANLTTVTGRGGRLHLICFSEHQPGEGEWGPRRISQAEIRTAFAGGWTVEEIEPAIYRINKFHDTTQVKAWRALLRRAH